MSHDVQRNHERLRLIARNVSFHIKRLWVTALLVLPSACGLFLEDYRIDDSKLRASSCQLGELRCVGEWLMTCAPTLDGWVDKEECESSDRCDSARGICTTCKAGEYRCSGSALELCNGDQSGWDLVEQCKEGVACNLNLQACVPCTPGESQCNQGAFSRCNAQGNWDAPTACGPIELCTATGCSKSEMCAPRKYACQDARLVRCDSQGVAWLPVETCASAELCGQTLAKARDGELLHCLEPTCAAQQARCEGNQLSLCSADRKTWVPGNTCSSDLPCNPKLRGCARCAPGENFCSGAELFTCDDKGAFQRAATCASEALCNAATGKCDPAECDSATRASCSATEPVLLQCGADKRVHENFCETPELCNPRDERCEVPLCAASALRCDGSRLQYCNSAQTGWDTRVDCGAGSFCDLATQSCSNEACAPNSFRCNDVFLERCGTKGYERVARCAAAALCHADNGSCDPPQCSAGTFHCLGKSLQKCGPNLRWVDFTTCSGQCDDIGGKCL